MWDAVILGGRQELLSFETFENLQHTYSWMKYYNNALDQRKGSEDEELTETIREVQSSINQTLHFLSERGR
jgi:hypothetical protein